MLKKSFAILVSLLILSCQNSSLKKDDAEDLQPIDKTTNSEPQESYQTIDNEAQAEELNKQSEEQAQEVEVQDRIFFGYDSSAISNEAKKILDVQVMWLKSDPSITITLEGHCDERGTREYNIALGERRANATKNYLVTAGISTDRITTISYGKERPAFFGNDEKVFAKNRRSVAIVTNKN